MSFSDVLNALRKEARLLVALPIKVFVLEDSDFAQWTCTYEVSRRGAQMQAVAGVVVGQEIWMQRRNRKAKYRVLWVGEPETLQAGRMGAECLEDRVIWDDEVQGRLA